METEEEEEKCTWNLKKVGGWEEYEKQTHMVPNKVEEIIENENISINECMKRIENLDNKVKFTAFGKTRKIQVKKKL